jgi:hypothetical protein
MYYGYLTFGGNEIINVARASTYAHNDGSYWLTDVYKADNLGRVLGDRPYRSPLQDGDAPWVDPDRHDTYNFYGLYPLDISGVDDSTRVSVITENIGDGGNAGRVRHGTRQMVFNCLMLGQDDAAVDAGMAWLRAALFTSGCEGARGCEGTDMCFFAADPPWEPNRTDCGQDYLRTIQRASVTSGPTVTAKNSMSDGASVWTVTFTVTAGIPWHFGVPVNLVRQFPDKERLIHLPGTEPDASGHRVHETRCYGKRYEPVFDPSCPDLAQPPSIPPIDLGCYNPPGSWRRYQFKVPARLVPAWTDVVPYIQIHTRRDHLRNMRIRIYADPHDSFDPDTHPCAFCGDFVISYCPDSSTMEIDGRDETVLVYSGGQGRRADGLVFGTDGMPFRWPSMQCGIGYVVTVDTLQTASVDRRKRAVVDFSLVPRFR